MSRSTKEKRIKKTGVALLAFVLFCAAVLSPIGPGKPKVYAAAANGYYHGIDVSSYNGNINWEAAKAGGVEFAIIRIGYGNNETAQDDIKAERNMRECERLGIPYGVYIYSYALSYAEVNSEIEHTIRMIQGHNPVLGIWFDMEDADQYKEKHYFNPYTHGEELTNFCLHFLRAMKARGYIRLGVYANPDYFWNVLDYDKISAEGWIWIAHWGVDSPAFPGAVWQYSASGTVYGNPGKFDVNLIFKGSTLYPIIWDLLETPANYSGYYAALSAIPEDLSVFKEESVEGLYEYIESIPRDLDATQQIYLDRMVEGIYTAIEELECAHLQMARAEAVDPTCTETGIMEHWKCERCGAIFLDSSGVNEIPEEESILPELGHEWGRWILQQRPTEEEDGYKIRTCLRCGEQEMQTVSPGEDFDIERGDIDDDGEITSADLTLLAKYVAGIRDIPDADIYSVSDINQDGIVDAKDLTQLAKFIANIISEL